MARHQRKKGGHATVVVASKPSRTSAPPKGQRRAIHRSVLQECPGCYRLFNSHRRLNDHRMKTNNSKCSFQSEYAVKNISTKTAEESSVLQDIHDRSAENQSDQPNALEFPYNQRYDEEDFDFDQDHNLDYDEYVNDFEYESARADHTHPLGRGEQEGADEMSCEFAIEMSNLNSEMVRVGTLSDGRSDSCVSEDDSMSHSSMSTENTMEYDANKEHKHSMTVEDQCYVELMLLLDSFDHPPPLKAFDLILDWCQGSFYKGFKFHNVHPARKSFVQQLKQKFGLVAPKNKPWMVNREPKVRSVEQEGISEGAYSIAFDATAQIESLLKDSDLMVPSKMVLNQDNRFHVYKSQGPVNEILDGSWYKNATKSYGRKDFCVPIMIFLDKTGGDNKNQRYPVFPIVMTFAIFNRATRNKSNAWRHLGFISNTDVCMSKAQKSQLTKGASVRNLHRQLDAIFDSLYQLQKRGLWFRLRIGNKIKKMKLWFPICLILGDGQQGDENTGRYLSHHKGMPRISRFCYCNQLDASNTSSTCSYIVQEDMEVLIQTATDEQLQEKSQHRCDISFFKADFGNDELGIFSIQPPCLQHTLAEGLVEYLLENFIKKLKGWQKEGIDTCVYPWLRGYRQTIRSLFPTCNFVRGITSITCVTADEKIGLLFSFALLASSTKGRNILIGKPPPHCQNSITEEVYIEYLHMFEAILCLEHTLARSDTGFWSLQESVQGEKKISDAINRLVRWLTTNCPRDKGNGWNLAKTHEIMDFPRHITRSGCPSNFNAAIGESLLRPMGKHFVPNAQFRRKEFCMQLAWRVSEQTAAQVAAKSLKNFTDYNPRKEKLDSQSRARTSTSMSNEGVHLIYSIKNATKILFRIDGEAPVHISVFSSSKSKKLDVHEVIEHSVETYMRENGLFDLVGYFEICINNSIYRCHPDHCSQGPWYDWAMVDFTKRNGAIEAVPCKLLLVLENRFHDPKDVESDPYIILAHCCDFGYKISSVLFRRWKLQYPPLRRGTQVSHREPILQFIYANNIMEHTYCFQESPGINRIHQHNEQDREVLQVLPRELWAEKFYNEENE